MSAPGDASDSLLPIRMPDRVAQCVARVRDRVGPVFCVGGVVRDAWLGIEVGDWDFATAATPDALRAALGLAPRAELTDPLGRVALEVDGLPVVFTTFRGEADYGADRWPARVWFVATPEEDAARRDFTVNAIYVDSADGTMVDPTGGLGDLRARRLRVIGDARARLREDPLRILRAVRFEASRGLLPTASTAAAMAEFAPRCASLGPERRFEELHRTLREPNAGGAVLRLLDTGVLPVVLPSIAADAHRIRTEALPLLGRLSGGDADDRWAALLGSRSVAAAELAALRAPKRVRSAVDRRLLLGDALGAARQVDSIEVREALRRASESEFGWALARLRVRGEDGAADAITDLRHRLLRVGGEVAMPTGDRVVRLGVTPGPQVGAVLRAIRERLELAGGVDTDTVDRVLREEVDRVVKNEVDPGR